MQAGVKWLTNTILAGGWSVGVVGGGGNPDLNPSPEWTSATPASSFPGRRRDHRTVLWVGMVLMAALWGPVVGRADSSTHSQLVCTVKAEVDPQTSERHLVTTCLHTERKGPRFKVDPTTLHVQIASGGCFYLGSRPTSWVQLGYDDQGALLYGWSPDGRRGGHRVIGTAQPCSWPSVEWEEIEGYVWSRIGSYVHQSPQVSFDPPVPWGMAGIETFAALAVPVPWTFSSTSPYTGSSLRAEVRVEQVRFDWDDGPRQVFGPSDFGGFIGYPNGVAGHTYQTKSCRAPGPRCRDKRGPYRIRTTLRWSGGYAVAGVRKGLRISDTFSDTEYSVRETLSLVVG